MPMLLPSEKNKTEQNPLKPKQKTNKKNNPTTYIEFLCPENITYFYIFTVSPLNSLR